MAVSSASSASASLRPAAASESRLMVKYVTSPMTPAIGTPTGWSVAKVPAATNRKSTTPTTWKASSAKGLNRSPNAASRRSKNGSQIWSCR